MASYDSYLARVNINGSTKRDRDKAVLTDTLLKNAPDTLSCKNVLINGVEQKVIIDTGTKPYYKTIKSLPNESFACGDYVSFANAQWLVINADNDNEVYVDGNLQQCNYSLKWQNDNAEIIERYCAVMSASQYNSGENATKTITVGYNQLLVYLPLDNETVNLRNDKRFFVDNNTTEPKVYRLTRIDTVTMSYQGVGCVTLLFTEDQYNPSTDNIEIMLCDYKTSETPTPQSFDITYTGQPQIRCGGSAKTFIANTDITGLVWSKICSADAENCIVLSPDATNNTKCKIKCINNNSLIGTIFTLVCTDCLGNESSVDIEIIASV